MPTLFRQGVEVHVTFTVQINSFVMSTLRSSFTRVFNYSVLKTRESR